MAGRGTAHLGQPGDALLRVENLVVEYTTPRRERVHAVSDVSFDVRPGETLGLVGESGCGKSTTAKAVMMLAPPTSGKVIFAGKRVTASASRAMRQTRRSVQMIFQDPISSLNSRRTVRALVAEGLSIAHAPKPWASRVDDVLWSVGLDPAAVGDRRPRELSGGQCQRVAIARALLLEPSLLVCDEAVSALDVSVRAQIINLLEDMKRRHALTMLFIAHDLAVVKNISDRVAVMYLGRLCEVAPADELFGRPQHPYTQALKSSVPEPDPLAAVAPMLLGGEMPSPLHPPSGCRFRTRCPRAEERCSVEEPTMARAGVDHWVACHFPGTAPTLSVAEEGRGPRGTNGRTRAQPGEIFVSKGESRS